MRAHPHLVAYEGAIDTELMRAEDGLVAKIGAEGVLAIGLADGRGLALKVRDGSLRAVAPAGGRARPLGPGPRRGGAGDARRGADRELARRARGRAAGPLEPVLERALDPGVERVEPVERERLG